MNGLIRLSRITTISVCQKEDKALIVFSDGRHRYGAEFPTFEEAKSKLNYIAKHSPEYFYVNGPIEEVVGKRKEE